MRDAGEALTREARAARASGAPRLRPNDAATLIILDRRRRAPRVLMGRRHPGHVFMPGKFVFPGGRIELGDRSMPVAGLLGERTEAALAARVTRPPRHLGRALALAAIRETYEETGLLLGTRAHGAPEAVPEGTWQVFRERGVLPDLEPVQFIARAITPPGRPRRFDTRFFAVDRAAVAEEVPGIVGPDSELSELSWVNLTEARALDLPAITRRVLEELEGRLEAGFAPALPVPFFRTIGKRFLRDAL